MNKKISIMAVYTFLISIFSFTALAQVAAPSTFFSNTYEFFRGIFTGNANIEAAYFISFVLYFIVFLAIYMEGLRVTPIFGAGGTINKQGKVFAVAASALSTIAIFFVEQSTGVSSIERLNHLLAPWGVWGGVAISAIVAFITYKLIKDSDTFDDNVAYAMAFAAAVGVTFAGFLLTIDLLIGWGFLITILVALVGLFAFLKKKRDEGADDRDEKKKTARDKEVQRYKDADDARKKRRDRKKREDKLKTVTSPLIESLTTARDLIDSLDSGNTGNRERAVANSHINHRKLNDDLKKVNNNLRKILRREKDKETHSFLDRLYTSSGVAKRQIKNVDIPATDATRWKNKVTKASKEVSNARNICALILDHINEYVKDNKISQAAIDHGNASKDQAAEEQQQEEQQ